MSKKEEWADLIVSLLKLVGAVIFLLAAIYGNWLITKYKPFPRGFCPLQDRAEALELLENQTKK